MAQRMMEVVLPAERFGEIDDLLEMEGVIGSWRLNVEGEPELAMVRIIAPLELTETFSDELTSRFEHDELFRLTFFSVEATVPKPVEESEDDSGDDEETKKQASSDEKDEEKPALHQLRVSREELYNNISDDVQFNILYVTTVILSVIVAAIGLMKGDVAVIIGAMVIAPLLAPNVALSLAATLGDLQLGKRALKVNLFGLLTGLATAMLIGWMFNPDPAIDQIQNRTIVNFGDIILALAAGAAGVLAFTRGVAAGVIGVMVAVALLPPLVVSGLMAGAGYWEMAIGAFVLTMANVCGLNLSGILTFLIQGVRPRNWWEARNARQATWNALLFWILLLIIFGAIIFFWQESTPV